MQPGSPTWHVLTVIDAHGPVKKQAITSLTKLKSLSVVACVSNLLREGMIEPGAFADSYSCTLLGKSVLAGEETIEPEVVLPEPPTSPPQGHPVTLSDLPKLWAVWKTDEFPGYACGLIEAFEPSGHVQVKGSLRDPVRILPALAGVAFHEHLAKALRFYQEKKADLDAWVLEASRETEALLPWKG